MAGPLKKIQFFCGFPYKSLWSEETSTFLKYCDNNSVKIFPEHPAVQHNVDRATKNIFNYKIN